MKRSDKPLVVENLSTAAKASRSVTVIDYQGMPTKQSGQLREKIRQAGGTVFVAKNTLLKRALKDANLPVDETGLQGPSAVVFANDDEIAPLQILGKSFKEFSLPKLKFGIFDGKIVDSVNILALSQLPAKNVLYGQLLGALNGPSYSLVGVLKGNLQKLVYILDQKSKMTLKK